MTKRNYLFALITTVVALLIVILLYSLDYSESITANTLLKNILPRLVLSLLLVGLLVMDKSMKTSFDKFARKLLFCLPCLFVALANFPLFALLDGTAKIVETNLIGLFAVECVAIALVEELFFRNVLYDYVKRLFKNKYMLSLIVSSVVFGLWHLVNLLDGASFGLTLLQVGYTTLVGAMLCVTVDKTNNVWLCVVIHALFDFGGNVVERLGDGTPWNTPFWIATAICGVFCGVHVLTTALRLNKNKTPEH